LPSDPKKLPWLAALALVVGVLVVYLPTATHEFVNFDDGDYVVDNPGVNRGLDGEAVAWAFTSTYAANWHPLTWLSHQLDVTLYGLEPGGHHVTSLLLHALNALLFFYVLRRMTGRTWPSFFAAALFAWHPLRVESVAWVSERKDLLSATFWLLTLIAYTRYARKPGTVSYLAVCLGVACSLMAKPMAVTLPYEMSRIVLDVPARGQPGQRLEILATVKTKGALPGTHLLHVRVLDPSGRELMLYGRTIIARDGLGATYIPLAYNDLPGDYTVIVRDVLSGVEAVGTVEVI